MEKWRTGCSRIEYTWRKKSFGFNLHRVFQDIIQNLLIEYMWFLRLHQDLRLPNVCDVSITFCNLYAGPLSVSFANTMTSYDGGSQKSAIDTQVRGHDRRNTSSHFEPWEDLQNISWIFLKERLIFSGTIYVHRQSCYAMARARPTSKSTW